ncbi:hypothetical protein JD292_00385 [Leucobacter sp. CSA2]|uniref:DAGKc domain-containing protein n=1 Tax=Leucobacter edaphi TaxID=2796472 RepID=A0A934UX39_9MICO|nr:diacylglycerol kinase family protein [Leucobacter edaphi]MBK0420542.1 hypothetical protein [Leucobacter edaphi]
MTSSNDGRELPFGLVVNPRSALGRGKRVAVRVARELEAAGIPIELISGEDANACAAAVAEASRAGLRGLILVGGDGLLGLVLQIAAARALPLGIVPAGSGNDFARNFGVPRGHREAVARILANERAPHAVDLGVVRFPDPGAPGGFSERWFAGGLSIGFDAAINRRANAIRLPIGGFRYQLGLVAEIVALAARPFRVRTGTREREFDGLLTSVMNIRTLGGGIPIAPEARTDDGMLDLIEVTACSRPRLVSVLGVLARGRHAGLPEVTFETVSSARIDAPGEIAYADGERVGEGPFEVRAAPAAIRLMA